MGAEGFLTTEALQLILRGAAKDEVCVSGSFLFLVITKHL
jgi:hypothetical protein